MVQINRCGLFVIDPKLKKAIVLKRRYPYESKKTNNIEPFVEQFCIPRGARQNIHEPLFVCSIREFIEECGFFFKTFKFQDYFFDLWWEDPINVVWKYRIFFMFADFKQIIVPLENKITHLVQEITLHIRQSMDGRVKLPADELQSYLNPISNLQTIYTNKKLIFIKPLGFRKVLLNECINACIINLTKYIKIIERQQNTYVSSNYGAFLEILQRNFQ